MHQALLKAKILGAGITYLCAVTITPHMENVYKPWGTSGFAKTYEPSGEVNKRESILLEKKF